MENVQVMIIQRLIDMSGSIIANHLSQPDWDARRRNISNYYKDLEPVRTNLPDAPAVREIATNVNPNANGDARVSRIVGEVCTPDLSPKELLECQECVKSVVKDPSVLHKYMKPSL